MNEDGQHLIMAVLIKGSETNVVELSWVFAQTVRSPVYSSLTLPTLSVFVIGFAFVLESP
jgi:hypothetical protein